MLSVEEILLEHLCPLLGVITANVMFFAPFKDVRKAVANGNLGDLNPTPWAFMIGNCLGWVTYSFLIKNFYVFFGNCPGFLLSVYFNLCAAKLQYHAFGADEMRRSFVNLLEARENGLEGDNSNEGDNKVQRATDVGKMILQVAAQQKEAPAAHEKMVVVVVVFWTAVISGICFADISQDTREFIVGLIVNLNLLFFYGAPLSTIFTVLKTQSSASIHIPLMVAATANGAFWAAFGFAVMDYFIFIPNGVGAILGVVQMLLCFVFPRSKQESSANEDNTNHNSLTNVNDQEKSSV